MSTIFSVFGHVAWSQATVKSVIMEIIFNLSCLLSIGVYRLLLHRCGKFPGPFGAKLSRFWTAYVSSKKPQNFKDLEIMQAKYGDFVRTGPREITVFRDSAVTTIYGPASKLLRSTWYALGKYQQRVKEKSDLLIKQIQDRAGQRINITQWAMLYSFDVLGEVALGKDFANLATGVEHSAIKPIHEHIRVFGVLSPLPWLMNVLTCLPSASSIYSEIFGFCADEIRAKQKASHL
ncbi:hypothetical protein Daus18300_002700 [Diaporthe australafricana]|uniref:Cytochrome P450 n=1 Tax=Diaporthe australafricana TaxID=127596 RepID=A0ABR3XKH4_9PEZI